MRKGGEEFIEVRVARYSNMELELGLQNYGLKAVRQEGKITKALTVRLSGLEGKFFDRAIDVSNPVGGTSVSPC